jgi:coenzyme F420 biosynthesis associated uncharacterized protein
MVIDWSLATQLAGFVAGDPGHRPRPGLPEVALESERLVSRYTGLHPVQPLPPPELLDRPDWIEANLRSMRPVLEPLTDRLGDSLGPLAPALRAFAGTFVAAELGVLMGFVARRVLGQYELVLLDAHAPARLLFVGPNLYDASRFMRADDDELLTWVALHEVTHALQFAGVSWLRGHMAGLVRSLIDSMEVALDPSRLMRVPSRADLRAFVDAVADGDLLSLVAGPRERELIDQVQATMAVLEGYAEHVMDVVGKPLSPRSRGCSHGCSAWTSRCASTSWESDSATRW